MRATPAARPASGRDKAPKGGHGVIARSEHGTGLLTASTLGIALQVDGKAKFSNSGVAKVPSGTRTVKVSHAGVDSSSIIMATIQSPQSGVYLEGAQAGQGVITFTLSKNATGSVPVGYLILEA